MHHKLCPSLAPRKLVSHQFWCASPWPSPLLPGKLWPSRSMENAGPGRGSCTGQSWPKATFLLSPGVTLATMSCQPELQAVQLLCSGQSKTSSPRPGVEGQKSQSHSAGNSGAHRGSRLAAILGSAPPRRAGGFGVLANRDAGGAAVPRREQCDSPPLPRRPSDLVWPEGSGSSSAALVPRTPATA